MDSATNLLERNSSGSNVNVDNETSNSNSGNADSGLPSSVDIVDTPLAEGKLN